MDTDKKIEICQAFGSETKIHMLLVENPFG